MTPADRQPRPPLRIAVLASGRGSNLQAILYAIAAGVLDATVVGVFSDKARAAVLEREHPLLVDVLRWFAAGRIALDAGRVTVDGMAIHAPLQLGLDNALTPAPHPAA